MPINHNTYESLYPFRAWVQQSLPSIYDDSLSYTDLLSKMLSYMNELITNNNLLQDDMKKAFDYIKATDFSKVPAGKIVLDGDKLYISVAEPTGKTKEAARMETHDKYIDIQMPLTAVETMGWKATNELKEPTAPYNPEKDITFFAYKPTTYIDVQPGEFAIFFPEDGHAPGIAEGNFRKVIVKVKI